MCVYAPQRLRCAKPLADEFPAVAEALWAAVERLRLAEEDERAAAKAQHMAEMEDKFEEMQMEQAAGEGGGAGSSSGAGL